MRRIPANQNSFSAGVWSPQMSDRTDQEDYQRSVRDMRNMVPLPTGPATLRPGLAWYGELMPPLAALPLTGPMVTRGGQVTGGGVAGDEWQGGNVAAINAAGDLVLLTVDFGAAVTPVAIDLDDFDCDGDPVEALRVEYDAGAGWVEADQDFQLGGGKRTRRAIRPPFVAARFWRVTLLPAPALAGRALSIGAVRFWQAGPGLSPVRLFRFADALGQSYVIVATDRAGQVWQGGQNVAALKLPWTAAQLDDVTEAQNFDTLIGFHRDVPPFQIFKQGDGGEWDAAPVVFETVAEVAFPGEVYTNGVNEIQRLYMTEVAWGRQYKFIFDGEESGVIETGDFPGDFHTRDQLQTALDAMDNIGPGNTIVTSFPDYVSIEFVGDLAQKDVPLLVTVSLDLYLTLNLQVDQQGRKGGEPIISASRGWPGCGTFYQNRLFLAGFRDYGNTIIGSAVGNFFEFDLTTEQITGAVQITADDPDATAIRRLIGDSFLMAFTREAVFWVNAATIVAGSETPVVAATRTGLLDNLRPLRLAGSVIYPYDGGGAVGNLYYSTEARGYVGGEFSARAEHLIASPVAAGFRAQDRNIRSDLYFLAMADGSLACFASNGGSAAVNDNFAAWTGWLTEGAVLDVASEQDGPVYTVVERLVAGTPRRYIEGFDPVRTLDASVIRDLGDGATVIDGLDHLEGLDVFAWSESDWSGPHRVTGGVIGLDYQMVGELEVGQFFDAWVEPHGLYGFSEFRSPGDKSRLLLIRPAFTNTPAASLDYLGNSWPLPFRRIQAPDPAALRAFRFTGRCEMAGITGWGRDAGGRLRRTEPGPFELRSYYREFQV